MIVYRGTRGKPAKPNGGRVETHRYQDLGRDDRALVDAARRAADTAYAPYSGIRVGAALRVDDGSIITGSNVENAAYGSTLCAERAAVGRGNAEGRRAFSAVAVSAQGSALADDQLITPCGSCRQVLHELARASGARTRVIMTTPGTDAITVADLEELLPLPFDAPRR
jgi:cytidine deaminase